MLPCGQIVDIAGALRVAFGTGQKKINGPVPTLPSPISPILENSSI